MARRSRPAAVPSVEAKPLDLPGVRRIIVVRESDAANRLLFTEMIVKTVAAFVFRLPSVARLLEIGCDVFDNPEKYGAQVVGSSKARTALFMLDEETLVMFHMGSAALLDGAADDLLADLNGQHGMGASQTQHHNHFTARLISVLRRHNPDEVWVYAINRLVRDFGNASQLQVVLKSMRIVVCDREREFDLNDQMGVLFWGLLTTFAAYERDGIVDRNTLGKIAQARRGEWPFGNQHVPFGYVPNGRSISPDPSMVDRVSKLLQLLAMPDLTSAEFVAEAAKIGVSRMRLANIHERESGLVHVAVHPKDVRSSFEGWLDLYETGTYRMCLPCPTASDSSPTYGGLPVWTEHRDGEPSRRMVTLSYDFGLPEGGWAPPSVFELIRRRCEVDDVFANSIVRGDRRPLGGRDPYPTMTGEGMLLLDTRAATAYRLRAVTIKPITLNRQASNGAMASSNAVMRQASTIATFEIEALHAAIADGIVDALSDGAGVEGEILASGYMPLVLERDEHRELVEARLERLRVEALRAAENARMVERIEARKPFFAVAEECARLIELAEEELKVIDSGKHAGEAPLPIVTRADIARMLAFLKTVKGATDGKFADALAVVLPRIEIHPTTDPHRYEWLATIRVPIDDDRVLELGPITGSIAARSARQPKGVRPVNTVAQPVIQLWAQGATAEEIATARGTTAIQSLTLVMKALEAGGFSHVAALHLRRAEPIHLRQLAISAARAGIPTWIAQAQPTVEQIADRLAEENLVPDGCDPRWAGHTLDAYRNRIALPSYRSKMRDPVVEAAVHAVADGRGTLTEIAEAMRAVDDRFRTNHEVIRRLEDFGAPLERVEPWVLERGHRVAGTNRFKLLHCSGCGEGMDRYSPNLEVDRGVLCRTCRVSPDPESPTYPASYFEATEHVVVPTDLPVLTRGVGRSVSRQAADMYQQGVATLTILDQLKISNGRLYKALEQHGVERRRPFRTRQRST